MKTYSESTLKALNKHSLIKIIKELYAENEILRKNAEHNDKVVNEVRWNVNIYKSRMYKAIEWVKDWTHSPNDWFEVDAKPSEILTMLQGNKEEE